MDELKYLVFSIEGEEYAFDIEYVKGIENDIKIVPIPNSGIEYLLGIINLRGEAIPVVSLRKRFNKEEKESDSATKLIITSVDKESKIAYKVDSVVEISDVDLFKVHDFPEVAINEENKFIDKVCQIGKKIVIILDLNTIFEREEIEEINKAVNED